MMGPHVALSTAPRGTPVLVEAAVGARRWWARVWQFRATAYVEVWTDAGFDAEAVVPTADVRSAMSTVLAGRSDLPTPAADVVFRAALTFAAATATVLPGRPVSRPRPAIAPTAGVGVVPGPTPARPQSAERVLVPSAV